MPAVLRARTASADNGVTTETRELERQRRERFNDESLRPARSTLRPSRNGERHERSRSPRTIARERSLSPRTIARESSPPWSRKQVVRAPRTHPAGQVKVERTGISKLVSGFARASSVARLRRGRETGSDRPGISKLVRSSSNNIVARPVASGSRGIKNEQHREEAPPPTRRVPDGMVQWVRSRHQSELILVCRGAVKDETHPTMDECLQGAKSAAQNLLGFTGKVTDLMCASDKNWAVDEVLRQELADGNAQRAEIRDGCCSGLTAVGMAFGKERRERAAALALVLSAIVKNVGRHWTKKDMQWPEGLPSFVALAREKFAEAHESMDDVRDDIVKDEIVREATERDDEGQADIDAPPHDSGVKSELDSVVAELMEYQHRLKTAEDACAQAVEAEEKALSRQELMHTELLSERRRCKEKVKAQGDACVELMHNELLSARRHCEDKVKVEMKAEALEVRRTIEAFESNEQDLIRELDQHRTEIAELQDRHNPDPELVTEYEASVQRYFHLEADAHEKATSDASEIQRLKAVLDRSRTDLHAATTETQRLLCLEGEEAEAAQEAQAVARDEANAAAKAEAAKLLSTKRSQSLRHLHNQVLARNEKMSTEIQELREMLLEAQAAAQDRFVDDPYMPPEQGEVEEAEFSDELLDSPNASEPRSPDETEPDESPSMPEDTIEWITPRGGYERLCVCRYSPELKEVLQGAKWVATTYLKFTGKIADHICGFAGGSRRWPEHWDSHLHAHATLKDGCCKGLSAVGCGPDKDKRQRALCLSLFVTAVVLGRGGRVWKEEDLKWPEGLAEVVDLAQQRYDAKFDVEHVDHDGA